MAPLCVSRVHRSVGLLPRWSKSFPTRGTTAGERLDRRYDRRGTPPGLSLDAFRAGRRKRGRVDRVLRTTREIPAAAPFRVTRVSRHRHGGGGFFFSRWGALPVSPRPHSSLRAARAPDALLSPDWKNAGPSGSR